MTVSLGFSLTLLSLLGMFPPLQRTTGTGGDLDPASSIYFCLITLSRPNFQIRSYPVLEEASFKYFQTRGSLPYARPALENEGRGASRPVRCHPLKGAQFHWKCPAPCQARPHLLLSEAKHPTKSACYPMTEMEVARPKGLQVQLLLLTEE